MLAVATLVTFVSTLSSICGFHPGGGGFRQHYRKKVVCVTRRKKQLPGEGLGLGGEGLNHIVEDSASFQSDTGFLTPEFSSLGAFGRVN